MSTIPENLQLLKVNGPLRIVPITPAEAKGTFLYIFILMGPTGSGKSSFIESLSPDQHLNISKDSLESVTQEVNCYRVVNLGLQRPYLNKLFVLMDTPGFLDPRLSEGRITRMVTERLRDFHASSRSTDGFILYFQPITDIRIGRSKRHAFKILREYITLYQGGRMTVITTMWNTLSTPRQLDDAKCRFDSLKSEIYTSSDNFNIRVTQFDASSKESALSSLDTLCIGWDDSNFNSNSDIGAPYQDLLNDNLLGRISDLMQHLQIIAENKAYATSAGREDHCLLEVVLMDETVALKSLQSFLDDLASDDIGPLGMTALQSLLDARYDQDPAVCSSPWPLSRASPLASPITLPANAALRPTVASDISSDPALVVSLLVAEVPSLDQLSITPLPTSSILQHQPPSPDASCFAPIAAVFKRRLNRTQG